MTVKCRLVVTSVNTENDWFEAIGLVPVFSQDPADPNYTYSQSTPSGQVSLAITNTAAFGAFQMGETYDIEFVKVEPVAPVELPVTSDAADARPQGLDVEDVAAEPIKEGDANIQGVATGFATPEEADAWATVQAAPEPVAAQEPTDVAPVTDGTSAAEPVAVAGPEDGLTPVPETPAPDAPAAG